MALKDDEGKLIMDPACIESIFFITSVSFSSAELGMMLWVGRNQFLCPRR